MIKNEKGTTIFELLLVLAIIALIASALVGVIYQIVYITSRGNNELLVQHDLQNAATWFNRDVLTAFRATIAGSEETGIYTMTLEVPYLNIEEGEISYSYITYTYSEETEDLTRDYGGSSLIIARHLIVNPFPPVGVFLAPQSIVVTLFSREGNVPGSGTFALKMRAGGYMTAKSLCQVTGFDSLGFDSESVTWVITNTGASSPSIDEIYIAWPITNSGLSEIWFNGNPMWDGFEDPPPATISDWEPGSREIVSGTQKTLEFSFMSSAVSDELQYSITITLTDNCTFSFPP